MRFGDGRAVRLGVGMTIVDGRDRVVIVVRTDDEGDEDLDAMGHDIVLTPGEAVSVLEALTAVLDVLEERAKKNPPS